MTRQTPTPSRERREALRVHAQGLMPPGVDNAVGSRSVPKDVPVIILNLFYTGLGIARELAGHGIRVVGISAHPNIYGNFTRFCEVRAAPNSQEQPEALYEFLLQQSAGELRGAVIFPTRDFDVLFLDRYRDSLRSHYRLAIPPRSPLSQVIDKYTLVCVAHGAGVACPKTIVLRSPEEFGRVPLQVGFPCVAKPVSSYQWREGANWERVGGRKAFLIDTMETLEREYAKVQLAHHKILVQEWIPGETENIVVLGGYVGANSDPLAYFTARKIIQSPDEYFGTGCVVRSEEISELLEPTRRLWRALCYRGMAEVEYKMDPRTGEFKLIEMNTRHWDQHELGRASGVNLSWTAYCDLTGKEVTPARGRTTLAIWIAEDSLFSHILRSIRGRKLQIRKLLGQISGPCIFGIFSWRDPWPFVRYFLTVMLPGVAKQAVRTLRKGER